MIRRLWRGWLGLRFRLIGRRRYDRLVLEHVEGCPLLVLPEVFNPALFDTGALLGRQLAKFITPDSIVLDMGTGSGIGAVLAAKAGAARVDAVDINPEAARCARINALLNRADDRVRVFTGDLFAPLEGAKFDLVLFNPPYFRGTAARPLDHAWRATDTVERFAAGLGDHLRPGGCALVVLSTNGDLDGFLAAFADNRLAVEVVAEQRQISETVRVYRLTPPTS